MNTIKVILAESGSFADLRKDFPLFQGHFRDKLLNIYVPTSLLAPDFIDQDTGLPTAVTAVKVGLIATARNGSVKIGRSYNLRFLKTLTYQSVEYALYERILPKEFTTYVGHGLNAPTMVINVVDIDTEDTTVTSIITSQTCKFDVEESADLDEEPEIEPSDLDIIYGELDTINATLPLKQDKTDNSLQTTDKTVVGGINELKDRVNTNESNIETNTENIAQNAQDIADLASRVSTGENFVAQMTGSSLPSDTVLNAKVEEVEERETKVGDVITFVLIVSGETDKVYKYIYTADGWEHYELPSVELGSNTDSGLVAGNYDGNGNSQVNIIGGKVKGVYIKDGNTIREASEFIGSIKTRINNIENGTTQVGKADVANKDGNGNNIVNTYMTKTDGASKQFVREKFLPKEFNDIFYLGANGYQKTVPTSPVQKQTTSTSVGYTELYQAELTSEALFNLASKNSSGNSIQIYANKPCLVQFRLITQAKVGTNDWQDLSAELTEQIQFTSAGSVKKIQFTSAFNLLDDTVISISDGDKIRQTLEVLTQTSESITFTVVSSSTYPSTFYLNTQSQVLVIAQGKLGEQPVIGGIGIVSNNKLIFTLDDASILENNTECQIVLTANIEEGDIGGETEMVAMFGDQEVRIVSPYNFESGNLTVDEAQQLISIYDDTDGYSWIAKGFIRNNGTTIEIILDMDNILNEKQSIEDLETSVADLEDSVVKFTEQTLTEEEKAQARENIGASSKYEISTTGESGTLTTAQMQKLLDDTANVIIVNDRARFVFYKDEVNYRTYISIDTPTTEKFIMTSIYVNTSIDAVNYGSWTKEEIDYSGGTVVDIGNGQYTYGSYVLPTLDVDLAREIYERDAGGVLQILHWELYGSENNLKVLSSDQIAGQYSIDVLVHNQFHVDYTWTDETTGTLNPNVNTGGLENKINYSDIVNNTSSTATNKPLSANMGKDLQEQINNLKARGRFLALWNATTGLASTSPTVLPYEYKAGDYFIVGVVASSGGTNYKPNGATYSASVPSTTVETGNVLVNDTYYYDGSTWVLLHSVQPTSTVGFASITGQPSENTNLASALNGKVPTTRKVNNKALSGDITLNASDVGALANTTSFVSSVNGNSGAITGIATTSDIPDISNKADKVSGATNGHFAGLDANGNLIDSGKKPADIPTTLRELSVNAVQMSVDGTNAINQRDVCVSYFATTGGYQWGRVYASGFKECGGVSDFTPKSNGTYTVGLGVTFTNTNTMHPQVTCGSWYDSTYACQLGIVDKTTNQIRVRIAGSSIHPIYYYVCGF